MRAVDADILASVSTEMQSALSAVQRQASVDVCGWLVSSLTSNNVSSVPCSVRDFKNFIVKGLSDVTSYTDESYREFSLL